VCEMGSGGVADRACVACAKVCMVCVCPVLLRSTTHIIEALHT
jgi:hypothetical protein